jgi:ATP-dependent Clp protease ATP-binding subunit ClpX
VHFLQVLTKPKNALGRQYTKLFGMNDVSENVLMNFEALHVVKNAIVVHSHKCVYCIWLQVKLHFTEKALRLIAKRAISKNTGARGLRSILETILTEAMYEVCAFSFCSAGVCEFVAIKIWTSQFGAP